MSNPGSNMQLPELYAEFVANNNRIAEIMGGYDNYVDYAYANVYGRDYDPTDVDQVLEYVKQYIVPVLKYAYNAWYGLWPGGYVSDLERNAFYSQVTESFFDNYDSNVLLNDYIDLLVLSGNDKTVSFSDEFDKLFENGNYFHGEAGKSYEGAYVTTIYGYDIPIAYFGPGYEGATTVAHEFGHYINEVYNQGEFDQSYDLLEMHSQGNELVFLAYLKDKLPEGGFKYHETYQLLNMYMTVVSALAVDTFEQAIYTDNYTGAYSKQIMADGTITTDEYDMLYRGILVGFGVKDYENIGFGGYWRYVTISAPCYYVSYSVSALSVLQLYANSDNIGFEATKDAYLKLFTYTDENPEMTTAEILENAGLYSFTDENLYILLAEMFSAICE
jgi:oligoendopeptidase F